MKARFEKELPATLALQLLEFLAKVEEKGRIKVVSCDTTQQNGTDFIEGVTSILIRIKKVTQ